MKKTSYSVVSLVLLFSLFSTTVFGASANPVVTSATTSVTAVDVKTATTTGASTVPLVDTKVVDTKVVPPIGSPATPVDSTKKVDAEIVDIKVVTPAELTTTSAESTKPSDVKVEVPSTPVVDAKPVAPEVNSDIKVSENKTTRVVTDGFYVDVRYSPDSGDYVPSFTLELWSMDDKLISSAVGNAKNYVKKDGVYKILLSNPGYKLGDQFAVVLRSADSIVNSVVFKQPVITSTGASTTQDFKVTVGTHLEYKVADFIYFEGANDETVIKDLTATKYSPLRAFLKTDKNKVGLLLKDSSGVPLKKTALNVQLLDNKATLSLVSDNTGTIWVDKAKLTRKFIVWSEGKTFGVNASSSTELELPAISVAGGNEGVITIPVVMDSVKSVGALAVTTKTDANTELSNSWANVDLTLTNEKGEVKSYAVDLQTKEISGIIDGIYTVAVVEGKYATAKVAQSSITINNGSAALSISFSPKYTLEVGKDGKSYNFSVVNVPEIADKQYKGKNSVVFAVTPNESFMVKDNDSGQLLTVAIDEKSPVTRVVLGAGIVFGGSASTPHTGDAIQYLLVLFALTSFGGIVSFILYRKKKQKISSLATSALSLLLIATLLSSVFAAFATPAHAANVGGTGPAVGGANGNTASGTFQTSDTVAVLQFGFIPSDIKKDSLADTIQDPSKFDYSKYMLYMAPNDTADRLLNSPNAGLLAYDPAEGLKTIYGVNPLYGYSTDANTEDRVIFDKHILAPADQSWGHEEGKNYLKQVMGDVLYNMNPADPNRSLSGVGNIRNIGTSLKDMVDAYILRYGSVDTIDKFNASAVKSQMFHEYLALLADKEILTGGELTGYTEVLKEAYAKGNLVFFAQTVVGISVKDNKSPLNRDYAFIPMHDATNWYLDLRKQARPTDTTIQGLSENKEFEATSLGGATTDAQGSISPYSENGNLPNTFRTYARDYYDRTLQPVTVDANNVVVMPSSGEFWVNPFGGWGYQPWDYENEYTKKPLLDAQLHVTEVRDDGSGTGQSWFQPVEGWEKAKELSTIGDTGTSAVEGSMQIMHDDVRYNIVPEAKAPLSLVDVADVKSINIDFRSNKPKDAFMVVPSQSDQSKWIIGFDYEIPKAIDLHSYLGGDGLGNSAVPAKAGYEGPDKFSNAKLVLEVKVVKLPQPGPKVADADVPQWRLSKFWGNIANQGLGISDFSLALPVLTRENARTYPQGNVTFSLVNPDLSNVPWAMSRAKLFNDNQTKFVSPNSTYLQFIEAGDLLAIRDNSSVANIKLADWTNAFNLYGGRIGASSKGTDEAVSDVQKVFNFQYGVNSNNDSFGYSETRSRWVSSGRWGYWQRYTWYGNGTSTYKTADYNTTVNFLRYAPKANEVPKSFAPAKESVNGKYWETAQNTNVLKVNPEVLMAYDDQNGRTSVAFAAGDKQRDIQPVHYNLAQFMRVNVDPTLTGMSTATDTKAQQLGASIANGKAVVYKGSATTTNFEVAGDLELKTFALDIGSSALKNSWNPGTTYSTDAINNEFLTRHASKDAATGKWKVTLDSTGKLVIGKDGADAKEYGGQTGQVVADQKSVAVKEHTLEIRGGKLNAVDGNRNLDSLSQELKDALTNMKVMGDDNIFNNFENGSGANLSEDTVANLGNAVRGTSDMGQGKGWYSEDTTILVVREYTNTFTLPSFMYVDKIPMEVDGLATPMDKNQFFTATGTSVGGKEGHLKLTYKVVDAFMTADDSKGDFGSKKQTDYVVPNVSIMDTFTTQ
jgi:LPXTG-motif cell wall-anchored protein